jgi:hypothetical protein
VIQNNPYHIEKRLRVVRELPWPLPALTVVQITDTDLDALDATGDDADAYWDELNRIVGRIVGSEASPGSGEPVD